MTDMDDMSEAFKAGMMRAVAILRQGASQHDLISETTNSISAIQGAIFTATVLRSYANGIEISAENGR